MKAFQNVSFTSVEELLNYLSPEERKLVEQLREIVFACIPDAKEKLAYNVPYYYRHSRICFIWPGSVPWGGIRKGVLLGFCQGHLLSDSHYLEKGERKNVYAKTFFTTRDIDREKISRLLYEAVWIEEEAKKQKPKKKG